MLQRQLRGGGGGDVPIGVGVQYCDANPNSTGIPAILTPLGNTNVNNNNFILRTRDLPLQKVGYYVGGRGRSFTANPGGSEGNLCLGGAIGRYVGPGQIQQSDLMGQIALTLDLTQLPQPNGFVNVMSGETWNFQAWYRDAAMGGGATSNFTDGLTIDFL